ncbi:hypothetical protein [Pedobacter sp. SYSU D00535]|uniref:hypothetical protein n=1 Tax=Pedobacter sp. SYSU D00535 TaxID=2810308 RepID=UPI001A96E254|nr:hypothetical protein [Pedobacter sp. SYSU D00535]
MRFTIIAGAFLALTIAACSNSDQPKDQGLAQQEGQNKEAISGIGGPFRFHKAIEVKPGLTFDVVSWGRGSEHVGSYLILRSDSSRLKYRTTSGELEGTIVDAWNMDMDSDGNPEIFIQSKGEDKDSYLNMYVYEFNDSGSAQELRFPDLTSSTKRTYQGKDSVYIKEGSLYREFPVFDEADTAATNPTGKKVLEYVLRGSSFSVKEVKEEDQKK